MSQLARRRKVVVHFLSKHASKISKQAGQHEHLLNKVTYCLGVLGFGAVCYVIGSRPHDLPYLYCLFFLVIAPLRWLYYRTRKWHYYLLDFCYYANVIFMFMLLAFPKNEKLFMLCFSFSEGPLAWALIVWRCSLVFSSIDKIVSVLIHLLPGTIFFIIRWWNPITYPDHSLATVTDDGALWTWLCLVPLAVYSIWQALYLLIVNVLRRQRLLRDPEVMTSFRELSRKASRANNIWWRLSGLLGDSNRVAMYALIQAVFTVATTALTVPMFKSYRFHVAFEFFKATVAVWNGGKWLFEVMPRQVEAKQKHRFAQKESRETEDKVLITSFRQEGDDERNGDIHEEERKAICSLCKQLNSSKELQEMIQEATVIREVREAPADTFYSRMRPSEAIACAS